MTTAKAQKEKFVGTVAELADKISVNGGLPLSAQELQFLMRVGNGSFAKRKGFAEGTGTRGGKRAVIWEINPNARISLIPANDAVMTEAAQSPRRVRRTKAQIEADSAPTAPAPAVPDLSQQIQDAVQGAVAAALKAAQAPRRRSSTKPAK